MPDHLPFSRRSFLWGAAAIPLLAQDDQPTFSIGVNVTNVLTTVRDKHGRLISDLTQDDFVIEEDGRKQEIRNFAKKADLPLTIGIVVDISGSQTAVVQQEASASFQFLDQVIREGEDRAFVVRFYRIPQMLLNLTDSRAELRAALTHLGDPKILPDGTALHDTVKLISDNLMKKQQGRKALFILSDGVDTTSVVPMDWAVKAAQEADTLVYCLGFYEDGGGGFGRFGGGFGGGRSGERILQNYAQRTGGGYYEVSNKRNAQKAFAQIEEELRNQYSLGYKSDGSGKGFRKIHVTLNRKDLKDATIQAREGYWPQS